MKKVLIIGLIVALALDHRWWSWRCLRYKCMVQTPIPGSPLHAIPVVMRLCACIVMDRVT